MFSAALSAGSDFSSPRFGHCNPSALPDQGKDVFPALLFDVLRRRKFGTGPLISKQAMFSGHETIIQNSGGKLRDWIISFSVLLLVPSVRWFEYEKEHWMLCFSVLFLNLLHKFPRYLLRSPKIWLWCYIFPVRTSLKMAFEIYF